MTYGESSFGVKVKQAGNPNPTNVTIEAPMLVGNYYGTAVAGYYNYYIAFSDKGLSSYEPSANDIYFKEPNAYYYIVDIYTNQKPINEGLNIPYGTYRVASGGTMHSINKDTSWLQMNDESGFATAQTEYENGAIVIEEGKVTLTVQIMLNDQIETHTVVYEGEYSLIDQTGIFPQY